MYQGVMHNDRTFVVDLYCRDGQRYIIIIDIEFDYCYGIVNVINCIIINIFLYVLYIFNVIINI